MATYILQTFIIESNRDNVEVSIGNEGKVFFCAESGHTYFELTKDEWAELVHFIKTQSEEG